ncbi:MAG: hypothetical protein Q4B67_08615 [Eubacteriales bacterium]|nr:hypothetical protein [Eubacteriales bacterium]
MFVMWLRLGASFVFSLWFAYEDLKYRYITFIPLVILAMAGVMVSVISGRDFLSIVYALIPGALLCLMSFVLKTGPGIGDGLYFLVMALFLNIGELGILLLTTLLFVCLFGLAISVFKNARNMKLPLLSFVPPALLLMAIGGVHA